MSRLDDVRKFLEFDYGNCRYLEPAERLEQVGGRLLDVLHAYNPGVIVKAGLGGGGIVRLLAEKSSAYLVVVEPSFALIRKFLNELGNEQIEKKIHFINGDFHDFPVDYYKADLIICVDCLDIFDSSRCIDEFRRALQFEGVLFLGSFMLDDEDAEGVFDEFMHMIFPLHNDFYLEEDLKTFLNLKEFRFIKGMRMSFKKNLIADVDYFGKYAGADMKSDAVSFLDANRETMKNNYRMDDAYVIDAPYYIGYFMRNKPA